MSLSMRKRRRLVQRHKDPVMWRAPPFPLRQYQLQVLRDFEDWMKDFKKGLTTLH